MVSSRRRRREVANHYRQFSVAVRLHGRLAGAWVTDAMRTRRRERQLLAERGYVAAEDIGIDFDWSIGDDGYLSITDDAGDGNVEHAAEFLQELIKLGYVVEPVAIYWADTCSKPRPDEFAGGAAIVTQRRIHWIVLPEIVERKLRAIERRTTRAKKRA